MSLFNISLGDIAVDIFFITSGFLITASLLSIDNMLGFVWARLLRIYPAIIVATLLTVFILGPIVTDKDVLSYITHIETIKYLVKNLIVFLNVEFKLPGVFENNPYPYAVNGSLWTLPHELRMYFILLVLSLIFSCISSNLGDKIRIIGLTVISIAATLFHVFDLYFGVFNGESLRLFSMFFIGVFYFLHKDKIKLSGFVFSLFVTVLFTTTWFPDAFFLIYVLCIPYLVFYLAYIPSGPIRRFNKLGDFSYGVYIYAFPIQQLVIFCYKDVSVFDMIIYASVTTLFISVLSWYWVEKKALSYKNSYVKIENIVCKIRVKLNAVKAPID
jgi:peptidoglycan/LPS O-acetylase OafA/YrhL